MTLITGAIRRVFDVVDVYHVSVNVVIDGQRYRYRDTADSSQEAWRLYLLAMGRARIAELAGPQVASFAAMFEVVDLAHDAQRVQTP